jgi:tRNA(Phe) wybutosine-synthesizing methylase Tyw3
VYKKLEISKSLLNPSLSEGFGSTVIEAISRKCKVIITPYKSSLELKSVFSSVKVSQSFIKEDFYNEVVKSINTNFNEGDLKILFEKFNTEDHILFYKKIFLNDYL